MAEERAQEMLTELTDAKLDIDDIYSCTYSVGYKYNEISALPLKLRIASDETPLSEAEELLVQDIEKTRDAVLKAIKNLEKSIKDLSDSMLNMVDHLQPGHNIFW